MNRFQKAAKIKAAIYIKKAHEEYIKNPTYCKQCNGIIKPYGNKISEAKRKTFCNNSCAASFNNSLRNRNSKNKEKIKEEKQLKKQQRDKELFEKSNNITKGELKEKRGIYYRYRSAVRRHAHKTFFNFHKDNELSCVNCGYSKHIQVCHINSVSSFSDEATLSEINDINNLIGLCPNCHWEFDNGHLDIKNIK